jgi:hypothetical protein
VGVDGGCQRRDVAREPLRQVQVPRHPTPVDGTVAPRIGASMDTRICILAVLCFLAVPTFASEPGQAMDCSDITFGEPGHSCSVAVSRLPPIGLASAGIGPIQPFFVDNEGNVYLVVTKSAPACPGWPYPDRWEIRRLNQDGSYSVVVASEARCVPDGTLDYAAFDPVGGRILVPIRSSCSAQFALCTNYVPRVWFAAIDGFPSLADVLSRKDHKHDNSDKHSRGFSGDQGIERRTWRSSQQLRVRTLLAISSSLGCVYTVVVSGETCRAKRCVRYRSWVIR